FRANWAGAGAVWEAWRRSCDSQSPACHLFSSLGAGWMCAGRDRLLERWHLNNSGATTSTSSSIGGEFVFTEATNSGTDFCAAPGTCYKQGHFFSDWCVLPALLPVFSPARAPSFLNIRIPSHYYYGRTRRYMYTWDPINLKQRTVDSMDVPWEDKRDAVWWHGASTGGGSSPPGFDSRYQCHQFLCMASVGPSKESTTVVMFVVPP
ncbi:hypothetical protein DFH09DRAFT_877689, partial [Mycena vulgaris]